MTTPSSAHTATRKLSRLIRIPQSVWRRAAQDHQEKVKTLLKPALFPPNSVSNSGIHRKKRRSQQYQSAEVRRDDGWVTALNPKNPVYNFLIEYYGLKGVKGVKRLARWSPSPNLLLQNQNEYDNLQELFQASRQDFILQQKFEKYRAQDSGILLEGANEEDMASLLHIKGAVWDSNGATYSPSLWYDQRMDLHEMDRRRGSARYPASPFLWYRSILQQTLEAEPILHCHGLHEWAMQYQPDGHPEPPSAKYQAHLPMRVSRQVINDTVERKGISCTHIDALRFFAPAASPLNHHGYSLKRSDQLRLEQPACVHAQMDLLKMTLRLQPFCNADLLRRILELALDARRLDIAASPYDVTAYGMGAVAVETSEGRSQYRKEQQALMERAEPLRKELLHSYNVLLQLAFDEGSVGPDDDKPSAERLGEPE